MSQDTGKLGRLSVFGLKEWWQVSLLLPSGWDDLTQPIASFDREFLDGEQALLLGRLDGKPKVRFSERTPRLAGYLVDGQGGKVGFSAFGDTRSLEDLFKRAGGQPLYLYGQVSNFNGRAYLRNIEIINPSWVGRFRPRYPGKIRVITPEKTRTRVLASLREAIPVTASWLKGELSLFGDERELCRIAGCESLSLEKILQVAHLPVSCRDGHFAQRGLERLAALGILQEAARGRFHQPNSVRKVFHGKTISQRRGGIPFALTQEQTDAVDGILGEMAQGAPFHGLLSGDVGTGKTAVYGLVCAQIADGGGRCVVLLPNEVLAEQVAAEFSAWWPDLRVELVTGSSGSSLSDDTQIFVGTTALLHRFGGKNFAPDLVVADEQQKFSREQRERLCGEGGSHLLEVTATAIPRSQALLRYGVLKAWRLTKPHTPKHIHTRIWYSFERASLFAEVRKTLSQQDQVVVVYPLREDPVETEEAGGQMPAEQERRAAKSVETAFAQWDKLFPGQVRFVHGQLSPEEKAGAIEAMRSDQAKILIATSVVEVGVSLPRLRRIVVVRPDRYGLTQLHQLRGRVARLGGEGWCDLYLMEDVREQTLRRLEVLEKTSCGFEVSEWDLRLRGSGDMGQSSSRQSGADETFLFGRPLAIEVLDEIVEAVNPLIQKNDSQKKKAYNGDKILKQQSGHTYKTQHMPVHAKKTGIKF